MLTILAVGGMAALEFSVVAIGAVAVFVSASLSGRSDRMASRDEDSSRSTSVSNSELGGR